MCGGVDGAGGGAAAAGAADRQRANAPQADRQAPPGPVDQNSQELEAFRLMLEQSGIGTG